MKGIKPNQFKEEKKYSEMNEMERIIKDKKDLANPPKVLRSIQELEEKSSKFVSKKSSPKGANQKHLGVGYNISRQDWTRSGSLSVAKSEVGMTGSVAIETTRNQALHIREFKATKLISSLKNKFV